MEDEVFHAGTMRGSDSTDLEGGGHPVESEEGSLEAMVVMSEAMDNLVVGRSATDDGEDGYGGKRSRATMKDRVGRARSPRWPAGEVDMEDRKLINGRPIGPSKGTTRSHHVASPANHTVSPETMGKKGEGAAVWGTRVCGFGKTQDDEFATYRRRVEELH